MEFPKKSQFCESHRNNPTQANDCQECSDMNIEKCGLCGKQELFSSPLNNIRIEDNLPDVCQCFLSAETNVLDATSEAQGRIKKTEPPVTEICDSVSNVKVKDDEISHIKESSNMTDKDLVDSSEESEILQFSHSSNGYLSSLDDLSSHQSSTYHKNTSSSGEDSKRSIAVNSNGSSGYPLSLGEKSSDQNLSDYRNITSQSSDEDSSKRSDLEQKSSLEENESNTNSDNKLSREYTHSESSQSDQKSINKRTSEESRNSQSAGKTDSNKNEKNERVISPEVEKIVFNNPDIKIANVRPALPRPFPQFPLPYPQIYPHSLLNMPMVTPNPQYYPQPYPQPPYPQPYSHFQSYTNTILNKPPLATNVPGRFPISSRPQLSTMGCQNPQRDESKGLSKKLLAQVQTQQADTNQNDMKKERIEDWLGEIELLPPDEQPSDSGWASGWSVASNEENERMLHTFSGTSTDERSSTEISEEENHRQRLLRRPPRNTKRGKPK